MPVADTGQRPVVAQLDGRDDRGSRLCQVARLPSVSSGLSTRTCVAAWPFSVATSMVLTVPAMLMLLGSRMVALAPFSSGRSRAG